MKRIVRRLIGLETYDDIVGGFSAFQNRLERHAIWKSQQEQRHRYKVEESTKLADAARIAAERAQSTAKKFADLIG